MPSRSIREEEEETSDDDQQEPNSQTFVDSGGFALCFLIHKSVRKPGAREKLTSDIEVCLYV
jgi:hypothetical protein